jgi:quercetin dioxygenase-like cupin family protein
MIDPAPGEEPASLPDPDGYFHPAGSGSRHEIFPGVEIRTTAGRGIMLSVVHLEPGSVVADHAHPHEQMGILLEGRLEFTVGGVTRVLGPGDLWRIPGGVVHSVRALDGPAVALDVFHPIREDYL